MLYSVGTGNPTPRSQVEEFLFLPVRNISALKFRWIPTANSKQSSYSLKISKMSKFATSTVHHGLMTVTLRTSYRTYSRITRVCSTKFSSMNRGVGLYASNSCLTLTKHDRPDGHAVKMRIPRSFHKDKGKSKYIVQLINFYLIFFCCNLNGDSLSTSKNRKNIQLFAETHGNRATPSYLLASV